MHAQEALAPGGQQDLQGVAEEQAEGDEARPGHHRRLRRLLGADTGSNP